MDRPRVGIVIPALNEERTISAVVAGVLTYGTPIVVDDGSCDSTAATAMSAGADVVSHRENMGYDQALESGFARAAVLGCEFIVTIDADNQHDPSVVKEFVDAMLAGAAAVVGIRSKRQRLAEKVFAVAGHAVWGIKDPLCGMKGYRTDLYRELGHFDSYGSIGTELAIYAARSGKRIVQLAVPTRDRLDSPRFGRVLFANLRILRALCLGLARKHIR